VLLFFPFIFSGSVIQLMFPQEAPSIFLNIAKNFKSRKADHDTNQADHNNYLENLEKCFSSPPFLKPSPGTEDTQDDFELDIGLSLTPTASCA